MNLNTSHPNLMLISEKIVSVIKRFPLPLGCVVAFFVLSVRGSGNTQIRFPYIAGLFCSGCWLIAFKLYTESHQRSLKYYYFIGIPISLILAWYSYKNFFIDNDFIFLGIGLFFSVFIAPFVNRETADIDVWQFNYDLWCRIILTILVAVILYLGLLAIVLSIEFLWNFKSKPTLYLNVWLFIATLFCPVMVIYKIPTYFDTLKSPQLSKVIQSLLLYVMLPIILIYSIILYCYALKIFMEWNLPKGGIAYMVSIFNTAVIVTYFLSYPLHKTSTVFSCFSQHVFKIILIPLVLLGVAIGHRIHEFGITEGRYVIVLYLIEIILIVIFAFVKKQNQLLKFTLSSGVFLIILASFGPWSASSMSIWSQTHRLEKVLIKHKILINGKIHKLSDPLSPSDKSNIRSMINYLIRHQRFDALKKWFDNPASLKFNKDLKTYNSDEVLEAMGIKSDDKNKNY